MRRDRTLTGLIVVLGLLLTNCQSSESSTSSTLPSPTPDKTAPPPTTSSRPAPSPDDDFEIILIVGPPSADIPRFTVNGQTKTIRDWWAKLDSGQCESLVDDTNTYDANSDNERATYALAFLYRGVAFACLRDWSSAAFNLEAASICRDDLISIGNSDQSQPLALLETATDYVQDHGEHIGGRDPVTTCGSEPTPSFSDTPTGELSSTTTSTP